MARALIGFLCVTLWFAGNSADAQSMSPYESVTRSEPRIAGPYPTSSIQLSAILGPWAVTSDDAPTQPTAEWTRDESVVAGMDSILAHRDASPWISSGDRGDLNGSTARVDRGSLWSTTEVHFQYGNLKAPTFASGRSSYTSILTFQHSSGWEYGDNYFFVDLANDEILDGFNDNDVYLEWYSNFSLGKILGQRVGIGPIRDLGILAGINFDADVNFLKWLPGLRFSWDLPGFTFFNTDFMAFIDDNGGVQSGGIPATTSTFIVDVNWALPFSIGTHDFSIEGHAEYVGDRRNELGNPVSWWFFAQPQFRYDIGKTLLGCPNKLFVGVEWQIWINKFGDSRTDENVLQALVVWRL